VIVEAEAQPLFGSALDRRQNPSLDDVGFGASDVFGGPVPMPTVTWSFT